MSHAPAPTAKRRMGHLNKLAIGAGLTLALAVLAVLFLSLSIDRWQAAVQPLSLEEVHRQTAEAPDSVRDAAEDGAGMDRGAAQQAPASRDATKPKPPNPMRLASRPGKEKLSLAFGRTANPGSAKPRIFVEKILWAGDYKWGLSKYGLSVPNGSPGWIGVEYAQIGDLDSARIWLTESIRVERGPDARRWSCSKLAWIEEDPQVAAALLDESLAGIEPIKDPTDPESIFHEGQVFDALNLCLVTGSEDMAEYLYQRYGDALRKPIGEGHSRALPETREWIRNRRAGANRE